MRDMMGYIEGNCPNCGERIRESCNAWVYGSPIRYCNKCRQEYLDKRWREVAIDGFDPKSTDPSFYGKCCLFFALVTVIAGGYLYYSVHYKGYYAIANVGIFLLGVFATGMSIVLVLRNVLGYEAKNNAKYLEESKKRLANPEYVKKLQEYGYHIPEEYQKSL